MSEATHTIDVLLVVDADFLLAGGSVANAVFLLAQRSQVDQSPDAQGPAYQDGGNELWIDVKKNDIIRWRATTLSRNADISAVISNVYPGNPAPGEKGQLSNIELVTPSEMLVPYMTEPGNTQFRTTEVIVSYWQANAAIPGKLSYRIDFYLLDSAGKNLNQQPFSWDPFITINQ